MELNKLADDGLLLGLEAELAIERKAAHNILLHLKEIRERRLYAKRGFPNLFSMLVGHFRQSESAASQRLKALELMLAVPVVEERLNSGDLSMSAVAMAQRQIQREEKLTGREVPKEKKAEIVESITGKTLAQAEIELFKQLPETASGPKNNERRIAADATRMNLTVPDDVLDMMKRLKELWAHVDPEMDNVEVMRRAFKLALAQVDPTQKRSKTAKSKLVKAETEKTEKTEKTKKKTETTQGTPEPAKHRQMPHEAAFSESEKRRGSNRLNHYGKEFDRVLWERAKSQCEFKDHQTGRRCECRFGLEREHIIPLAKGGTNELGNMELLCRAHNQLRARQVFGHRKIEWHQSRNLNQ